MNKILIKTLSTINGLLAIIIVLSMTIFGFIIANGNFIIGLLSALFGAIGGIVIAAILCGFIAYLTIIEKHLSIIANQKPSNIDHSKA